MPSAASKSELDGENVKLDPVTCPSTAPQTSSDSFHNSHDQFPLKTPCIASATRETAHSRSWAAEVQSFSRPKLALDGFTGFNP